MRCCTRREPSRRFGSVSDLREAILSLGQIHITASEPQVADFITALTGAGDIPSTTWRKIVEKIEDGYPSTDVKSLLQTIPLHRITELVAMDPTLAGRLGTVYGSWVKESSFNFETCDGIANRLQEFMRCPDYSCQAEIMLALLIMGTSHNRWYVERKFAVLCDSSMDADLARRVALEIRVLGARACQAVRHLERSIGVSRNSFHPTIVSTLNQVC